MLIRSSKRNYVNVFPHLTDSSNVSPHTADCSRQADADVSMTCKNQTLTILWPTDQTYGGNITKVPSDLHRRVTDRLSLSARSLLKIVVINLQPPYVSMIITAKPCLSHTHYTYMYQVTYCTMFNESHATLGIIVYYNECHTGRQT